MTVQVPRRHHLTVAENGAAQRRIRSKFNVNVNHGRSKLPQPPRRASRIDDEDFKWEVVGISEEGYVPWILRGTTDQLNQAQNYIQELISKTPEIKYGFLLVPSSKHRLIIGPGGSTINKIRTETHCQIDVPRDNGDAVTICGPEDRLTQARDMILELM